LKRLAFPKDHIGSFISSAKINLPNEVYERFLDSRQCCVIHFHAHIAPGDHNPVRSSQDLIEIADAFRIKDIRQRLLFVLLCLFIIRVGSQIPVPGVNREYFSAWFEAQTGNAFNFFDAFTGGSFSSMSILALSITPYITASIII
jgi:hypothetical protein